MAGHTDLAGKRPVRLNWRDFPHFTARDFVCPCGCGRAEMDPLFMQRLQRLRGRLGFALPVSGGFRCPAHDARSGYGRRGGPHTTGRAAHVAVSGMQAYRLLALATELEFSGIGIRQRGPVRHIHLDMLASAPGWPRPVLWVRYPDPAG